jgi:hypothetical protein
VTRKHRGCYTKHVPWRVRKRGPNLHVDIGLPIDDWEGVLDGIWEELPGGPVEVVIRSELSGIRAPTRPSCTRYARRSCRRGSPCDRWAPRTRAASRHIGRRGPRPPIADPSEKGIGGRERPHATPVASRTLGLVPTLAAYPRMLEHGRKREGLRVCRAAWLLGMKVREYRETISGDRDFTTDEYERACRLFGWPQSFWTRVLNRRCVAVERSLNVPVGLLPFDSPVE